MTRTDQDSIALLRIGSVTAVKTSGIEITVDADKNEPSILYNGDIIDNVTIGKYVIIHRGYRKLVVRVEEEYLTEDRQWRDDEYHRDEDRYKRTLRAILQGELIDGSFERGRAIMPMIGNTAYIATKQQIDDVFGSGDSSPDGTPKGPTPPTLEIGSLNSDPSVRFRLDIGKFFASHIGIFGNTGSGKSYTLTQLYTKLFGRLFYASDQEQHESPNEIPPYYAELSDSTTFLFFDLNGEYSDIPTNNILCEPKFKNVFIPRADAFEVVETDAVSNAPDIPKEDIDHQYYDICTTRVPIVTKIPLLQSVLDESDFWHTVLDATEKTQRPFIDRSLRFKVTPNKLLDYCKNLFNDLLQTRHPSEIDRSFLLKYIHDLQDIFQIPRLQAKGPVDNFFDQLQWHSVASKYILTKPPFPKDQPFGTLDNTNKIQYAGDAAFKSSVEQLFAQTFENAKTSHWAPLKVATAKLLLQFYSDANRGYETIPHLKPLISRFHHRIRLLEDCFNFGNMSPNYDKCVVIINLRYCSIEERKIIPLIVTRSVYKEHKLEESPDSFLNIIIDEAHNLLSYDSSQESEIWKNTRLETFEEILKEGRKFGVFVTLASQRPYDISATITSQLHHYILHQLVNPNDLEAVRRAVSYLDKQSFDDLPSLPRGTCIVSGTSVQIPAVVRIDELPVTNRPISDTIDLVNLWRLEPNGRRRLDPPRAIKTKA